MGLFLVPYSIPLVYAPAFMLVQYCFDDCTFVKEFEIGKWDASPFALLSQDWLGYLGPLYFRTNFRIIFSSSVKIATGILIGIAPNLQFALGCMGTLVILILPIHEHRVSFYLFAPFWFV